MFCVLALIDRLPLCVAMTAPSLAPWARTSRQQFGDGYPHARAHVSWVDIYWPKYRRRACLDRRRFGPVFWHLSVCTRQRSTVQATETRTSIVTQSTKLSICLLRIEQLRLRSWRSILLRQEFLLTVRRRPARILPRRSFQARLQVRLSQARNVKRSRDTSSAGPCVRKHTLLELLLSYSR